MKRIVLLLFFTVLFVQGQTMNLAPNDPNDQVPFFMAQCFTQILIHGLTAAQAGNNKELRIQELSQAIHCFAQFLVQFFNTPKRSMGDDIMYLSSINECINDPLFMSKLADAFGSDASIIVDAMQEYACAH
jgi:hypothetical protein